MSHGNTQHTVHENPKTSSFSALIFILLIIALVLAIIGAVSGNSGHHGEEHAKSESHQQDPHSFDVKKESTNGTYNTAMMVGDTLEILKEDTAQITTTNSTDSTTTNVDSNMTDAAHAH